LDGNLPLRECCRMTHTVHIDRRGYVEAVFRDQRKASLDAKRYPGTLMEVTGDVVPGWHWDGEKFSLPPPRITPEAVRAERDKRIDTPFPKGFRDQATALGGDNALAVSGYVAAVMKVAESFLDDAPQDYRDDRHWPKVPKLRDLPVPQRVEAISPITGAPVNITVAPVIHATPAEPKALVVEHRTVTDGVSVSQPQYDDMGLPTLDPLYEHKARLISFIREEVEPRAPDDDNWKDSLGRLASLHTAAQSMEDLEKREADVVAFLKGAA
jgi:hypothetical protein